MTESEKLNLGILGSTALNSSYTCSVPDCSEIIHVIKNGCPNEAAVIIEARKIGSIMSTTIQYIKDNPASIL